jgi:hypothetical protein
MGQPAYHRAACVAGVAGVAGMHPVQAADDEET